jgi:hypothetical protein
MSIRSIGIFVTGLAVLATTAYFVKKNYFQTKMHSPDISAVSTQAISSCVHSKKIQSLVQNVEASTKLDSAYSITLPLLGAAYTHNKAAYNTWKHNLFKAFSVDENATSAQIAQGLEKDANQNAWLLGRLVVASMLMKDDKTASKAAEAMKILLEKKATVDCFSSWAWGYLAIYTQQNQPNEYPAIKKQMLETIQKLSQDPQEKGKDNVSWAIVMALQGIDSKADYYQLLQDLVTFTDSSSVVEALNKIPAPDFRAWAMSLTLDAAKKKHDELLIDTLSQELPKAIESTPSDADKMLGLLIGCST